MTKFLIQAMVFLVALTLHAKEAEMRTWTSNSGKKVEAVLVTEKNGKVLLKNADGWSMSVPVAGLSQADQDYLAALKAPAPEPEPASADTPAEAAPKQAPATTKSEGEEAEEEVVTGNNTGQKPKMYTMGDEQVRGYLRYRFKSGLTAIVFTHHRRAITFYHPRLGRTYSMTIGGHDHNSHGRMIIDDVMVRPPNVRVRWHEEAPEFRPEGYTIEERKAAPKSSVLQGELRLTFHPEGFQYASYAKALAENAPRHFVHFHAPELTHNINFRGGPEKLKEVFAESKNQLVMRALPKKTLEVNVGERISNIVLAARRKYKTPSSIKGYLNIAYANRAGNTLFACATKGEGEYLNISTYGNEPMERRSWIGHHKEYTKRYYNFIPHPTKPHEYIRMKKDTIASFSGEVKIQ